MNGSNGGTNNSRPLDSYGGLTKKINKKVTPDAWRRGIISAVHMSANTADVTILGNNASIVKNVPLSSAIDVNAIRVGDKCRLDMFDETNPNDCVVAYTYGRQSGARVNGGLLNLNFSGSTIAIPHGLGVIPNLVSIDPDLIYSTSGGHVSSIGTVTLDPGTPPDATNIYVFGTESGNLSFYWFAAYI